MNRVLKTTKKEDLALSTASATPINRVWLNAFSSLLRLRLGIYILLLLLFFSLSRPVLLRPPHAIPLPSSSKCHRSLFARSSHADPGGTPDRIPKRFRDYSRLSSGMCLCVYMCMYNRLKIFFLYGRERKTTRPFAEKTRENSREGD